jgi:hypothetical protein
MPRTAKKRTLKDIHTELTAVARTRKAAVLKVLGVTNEQVFFNILNGDRKLSDAEKKAIADIYETAPEAINWKDQ